MPTAHNSHSNMAGRTERQPQIVRRRSKLSLALKRAMDLVLSLILMVLSLPVLLLSAIAVRLDSPGPILWLQSRVGLNGKHFRIMKFRTMVIQDISQERYLRDLVRDGGRTADRGGRILKIQADPRITRVGQFLRRFGLNELPSILNVLKGDMSIVGPRAAHPYEIEFYSDRQKMRLNVKPGITGAWQILGQTTDFETMVEIDLEYVSRQSLMLDLLILIKTIPAIFRRSAFYLV